MSFPHVFSGNPGKKGLGVGKNKPGIKKYFHPLPNDVKKKKYNHCKGCICWAQRAENIKNEINQSLKSAREGIK